jgi:hypothetical protein
VRNGGPELCDRGRCGLGHAVGGCGGRADPGQLRATPRSTARGESTEASDAALTPAGHGIRYDAEGRVIGVTIINARMLLDRDGHLTITLPHEVHVDAGDLAGVLS